MARYKNITKNDIEAKLLKYNAEHKVYCEHCGDGHGAIFYKGKYDKDRKICENCGYWIYKDKKTKLKYEMKKRGILV